MTISKSMIAVFAAIGLCVGADSVSAADKSDVTCIVIPARPTVVRFAFDVMRLRQSVYIVSYDQAPEGPVVMHIWNDKMQEWKKISTEEYQAGSVFTEQPGKVVLVGRDKDLPSELSAAPTFQSDVSRIGSLDLVALMTGFHEVLSFSEREWKWLAPRFGIAYKDMNAERRKYGRYGRPGSDSNTAMPEAGAANDAPVLEMPAEVVVSPDAIVESKVQEAKKPAYVPPENK